MKRIGILGGTFDPIHYGHLIAAEAVTNTLGMDYLIFMPCGHPPHKDPATATPAEHRYLMTVLATTGNPAFRVSRLELDRPGPSYTVDTLSALIQRNGRDVEWFLVVGADAFLDMPSWKQPEAIMSMANLAVVSRRGYDDYQLTQRIRSLPPEFRRRIFHLPAVAPQIASHELRRMISQGQPVEYYIPPSVLAYIRQHDLYGDKLREQKAL